MTGTPPGCTPALASDRPEPFALIGRLGLVPVIAIESAADAVPLADALLEGGLPVAEITLRTPAASEVLARLHESRPDLTIGAGTLLARTDQIREGRWAQISARARAARDAVERARQSGETQR